MTSILLHADLIPDKYTEFMQSWQTFIEHVREDEGLVGFELKQSNTSCDIILRWKNQNYLDSFTQGKWYAFIVGAINVLGDKTNIAKH